MSEDRDVGPHVHVWERPEVVVSRWVLAGLEPIRMVIHHEVGDWSVVCGTVDSPGELVGMPLSWLWDRRDVGHLATSLAPGRMVTRDDVLDDWVEEDAPADA